MNPWFKISLTANIVLALTVCGLISMHCGMVDQRPAATQSAVMPSEVRARLGNTGEPRREAVPPATFRWSQLESSDYRVYVKNLRAIGCPELTLQAIVQADVHAACEVRIEALKEKIAELDDGSWLNRLTNYGSAQDLRDEMLNMPAQEYAEVCDLLGLKIAPVQVASDAPTTVPAREPDHSVQSDRLAPEPLIFEPLDPAQVKLTAVQEQVIEQLQKQFWKEIGGPDQDTNSPAYLARWQRAQHNTDDALRGLLGSQFYLKLQLLAANQPAYR